MSYRAAAALRRHITMLSLAALVVAGLSAAIPTAWAAAPPAEPNCPVDSPSDSAGTQYRYVWTSRPSDRFTSTDLDELNRCDPMVIIEKGHDGGSFAGQDDDATLLANMSNHPRVFANFLGDIVTTQMLTNLPDFSSDYYLKDANGDPIEFAPGGVSKGHYVDVTNPDYRAYIASKVIARMAAAPYSGIIYDTTHGLEDDPDVVSQISPAKLDEYDADLHLLLSETKTALDDAYGAGTYSVFFNGVAPTGSSGVARVARGTEYVTDADGTQDEFYCYRYGTNDYEPSTQAWDDITLYRQFEADGKTVLHTVKILDDDSRADEAQIKSYCFAQFLMEYTPGRSLIQFKVYPSGGQQIERSDAPQEHLNLGLPTPDGPQNSSGVISRTFAGGCVVVNTTSASTAVTPPCAVTGTTVPITMSPNSAIYVIDGVVSS